MMKFTPEFIAKQRELAKAIGIEPGSIFRKNDTELGAISGYDSETGVSYSGAFAVFLTKHDATYAHEALSNYPAALDEIERQQKEVERLELGEKAADAEITRLREKNRWHDYPAEKPEKETTDLGENYICQLDYPYEKVVTLNYEKEHGFFHGGWGTSVTSFDRHVLRWRELPELPEPPEDA